MPKPDLSEIPFYKENTVGKLYIVEPIQDMRKLEIYMQMPKVPEKFETQNPMTKIIHHILGHESEGSLLALLKKENLAVSLSAGPTGYENNGPSFSKTTIFLTEHGVRNYEKVIQRYFEFCQMLKNSTPLPHELWKEQADYHAMTFKFSGKVTKISGIVKGITSVLHENYYANNPNMIFWGSEMYANYTTELSDLVTEFINSYTFENASFLLIAQDFKNEKWPSKIHKLTEPVYNATYGSKLLSENFVNKIKNLNSWPEEIYLPAINVFMPENFDLIFEDTSKLETLGTVSIDTEESQHNNQTDVISPAKQHWPVLYKKYNSFIFFKQYLTNPPNYLSEIKPQPKLTVRIKYCMPNDKKDWNEQILRSLLGSVIKDSLNKVKYMAERAGIDAVVKVKYTSLEIMTAGFHQRQGLFLKTLLDMILGR